MRSRSSKKLAAEGLVVGVLAVALAAAPGPCATLDSLAAGPGGSGLAAVIAPTIAFSSATLVQAPSQRLLAAYYCPELVAAPLGAAGLLCQQLFGRRPSPAEMNVAFDLRFHISNPNQIPIPVASVLTAATVFPSATNQRLGVSCFQLCAAGQPGCGAPAAAGACEASSRDVRSLHDFAGAALDLLIANGVAAATGQPLTFEAPRVSAAAALDVIVRFSFGPEPLLATLRQLAAQSVDELKAGRSISFRVPFRIEGTVWFDGGSFGRIAVGYGPLDGVWVLPTDGLIPR